MKTAMLGCIEGRGKTPQPEFVGFQSRYPSLSTGGKPGRSEHCLSAWRRRRSRELRSARFSEERKEPLEERRGIRVPFSLVRFFWAHKRNEHTAGYMSKRKQME
jgi:hypothetical protein